MNALETALGRARAGDVEGASAMLDTLERELANTDRDVELLGVLFAHARMLVRQTDYRWRELAVRKAMVASELAKQSPEALQLEAMRVKLRAFLAVPGRARDAIQLSHELIERLERAPADTRAERATLWHLLGHRKTPHLEPEDGRLTRAKSAPGEACLRRAIALYVELLRDASAHLPETFTDLRITTESLASLPPAEQCTRLAVHAACWLAGLIGERRGFGELETLSTELARSLPRTAAESLRHAAQRAPYYDDDKGHVTRMVRQLADRLDARVDDPPLVPTLARGSRVHHPRFGSGVARGAPSGSNAIVEVEFEDGAVRKLTASSLR